MAKRAGGAAAAGGGGLIYSDTFESAPSGALQSAWTAGDGPSGATLPNGTFYYLTNHGGQVLTANPITGSKSLNFVYPAVADDVDQNQEQRLILPVDAAGGFGMEWDQRISSNFVLRDQTGGTTSKWFQFWRNDHSDYSSSGSNFAVGASFRRSGVGNQVELMVVVTEETCFICNLAYVLLIDPDTPANAPLKPGQVHNIKWYIKYASSAAASDGTWEMLVDGAVVYSNTAMKLWPYANDGTPTVRSGYLMGYTNAGYSAETTWTWDNLKFYNQSTRWW